MMHELSSSTTRIRRELLDRLKGFHLLSETKVTDGERVAYGRGPNPQASQQAHKEIGRRNLVRRRSGNPPRRSPLETYSHFGARLRLNRRHRKVSLTAAAIARTTAADHSSWTVCATVGKTYLSSRNGKKLNFRYRGSTLRVARCQVAVGTLLRPGAHNDPDKCRSRSRSVQTGIFCLLRGR
jgi:hypothetical protein